MECSADELFTQVVYVVDAALAHAREIGVELAAVATAAFWHSVMGLSADGRPATPVYGWGDTRATGVALELRAEVDEVPLHRGTGCFLHPSYPTVKLAWLRRNDPDSFARVPTWVSFPEYLEERLFGIRRCSLSMASGSGLLDVHRLQWDAAAMELAGVRVEQLSPLVDTDAPAIGLRPEFAARWPELASIPWFPPLGDGACANVGSGAVGLERLGLTVGTSAAVRALWEPGGEVLIPDDLWCYRLDGRRWVAGGALSNGGNGIAFLRQTLQLPEEREWEASVGALEPDGHGLTVLPFLMGERGPAWLRERRSVVLGMTPSTTPEQLIRAWVEALSYRIGRVAARLEATLGPTREVLASGGALHASPLWARMLADVLDRPLALSVEPEATSRGAALVALERLGLVADLAWEPPGVAVRYTPDPARTARYSAAMRRQQSLLVALSSWLEAERPGGADRDVIHPTS